MGSILGIAWENIFIGLLGGAIVSLIGYAKKKFSNMRLEKRFPISGMFITKFQDETDGEMVSSTAPAELKQKGNKIYGTTRMPDDSRTWILEGEISTDGHIHGIYFAEDPIDKGIGNFFLKVDNKRHMIGLWSGFDSANNKINSGRYEFKPVLNDIIIKKLTKDYIPHILDISDKQLGKDYLTHDILEKIADDSQDYFCEVAIDIHNKIIGFYLGYIIQPSQIEEVLKISQEKIPRALKYANKIGVLKTIAIDDRYQGYGIGTKLTENSIQSFRKANAQMVCSVAWKSKKGINIGGILSNLQFKCITELPEYWKEDSIEKGYECPVCGQPPCVCSAVIYNLIL